MDANYKKKIIDFKIEIDKYFNNNWTKLKRI